MKIKLWIFLVGIGLGGWGVFLMANSQPPTRQPAAISPLSLLGWGMVITLLLIGLGLGTALVYWAVLRAQTRGRTIYAKQGLYPLLTGRLGPGERYIFDLNRTSSPAVIIDQHQRRFTLIDGGPDAVRVTSQAQITQALQASTGQIPGQHLVQALSSKSDQGDPLPPVLPLPDNISLEHLDSLVEKLEKDSG